MSLLEEINGSETSISEDNIHSDTTTLAVDTQVLPETGIPPTPATTDDAEKVKFLSDLALANVNQAPSGSHIIKISAAVEQFLSDLSPLIKEEEYEKSQAKVWKAFRQLENQPPSSDLSAFITKSVNECREQMVADPENKKWGLTFQVLNVLQDPIKVKAEMEKKMTESLKAEAGSSSCDLAEAKKKKKLAKMEKKLKLLADKIKEYDEQEVEWESEEEINSSYMIKTRLVDKFDKVWKEICDLAGAITHTDRPVQKVVRINQVTHYPEIDDAAEKFLNSKGALFVPDYPDMLKVVIDTNRKHRLYIDEQDVGDIARELFQNVIKKLKKKRAADFVLAFEYDSEEEYEDPAAKDPELARKLEENVKKRKTEEEVMRKYAERTETAEEVADSDPDASAPEEDDEDETEQLAVEQDTSEEVDSRDSPPLAAPTTPTIVETTDTSGANNAALEEIEELEEIHANINGTNGSHKSSAVDDDSDEIQILEEHLDSVEELEISDDEPPVKRAMPTRAKRGRKN